jgi:transposase InsO family protein
MPLKAMDLVEQRLAVLQEPVWSGRSVREVCARHGISRETFYAWRRAYERDGLEGLVPRSRRPASSPGQLEAAVEDRIVRLRKDNGWGARKIRDQLRREGHQPLPAVSTVGQALARRGQGPLPRVRMRNPAGSRPRRFERRYSNELWQIDGSMHRLADGSGYWVADIVDDHSRFLVGAEIAPALTCELAWAAVRAAVARHGQPEGLLSDNGLCFTGRLQRHTVAFERQVARAGMQLSHSRPYHPQTCGKIERFHLTYKQWLARRAAPATLTDAAGLLAQFTGHYNHDRPHQALDGAAPVERYQPGEPVQLPRVEVEPADPTPPGAVHRRVDDNGNFIYARHKIHIGRRWIGVRVGLIREGGRLHVFYGAGLLETFGVGLDCPTPKR